MHIGAGGDSVFAAILDDTLLAVGEAGGGESAAAGAHAGPNVDAPPEGEPDGNAAQSPEDNEKSATSLTGL